MRASKKRRVPSALIRPTLWFCACNLLAAALSAQCTGTVTPVLTNQTVSSGTATYSDNNALSTNAIVNVSASITLFAGHCIELQPGFHATAGTAGTTFHAWVDIAPNGLSVSPVNATLVTQQFIWTASSPAGSGYLSDLYALFNSSVNGSGACYIHYNAISNMLSVTDGTASNPPNWSSGVTPGSSNTTGNFNPYCTVNGSGSSFSTSGNQLLVTVSVTAQGSFVGIWNDYLIAYDQAGLNSAWQQVGTWTVPAGTVATPTFSLASGTYTSSQTVTISTSTPGASIRYTTDGTTPTETSGTLYSGAITIASTTTVKAIAYKTGWLDSGVSSATYTITGTVATPNMSPTPGTYTSAQTVSLSTATPGASIRYTIDGSTPTETAGTAYSGAFTVSSTATVKAIAYESGWLDSAVAAGTYTITGTVGTPVFSPAGGSYANSQLVTITTSTPNATIRYTTDGSTPSENAGTIYRGALNVPSTMTIKAIAYESGWADSAIGSATYNISGAVVTPALNPAGGTYSTGQSVTITTTTPNATIRYTSDGSTPSETYGTVYTGPISISTTTTLKAIAYVSGLTDSAVVSAVYTIGGTAAAPTISPAAGTYTSVQTMTLNTTTVGASIRYTTDGSTPTETQGTLYSSPFMLSTSATIKAMAYAAGWADSPVASAAFTLAAAAPTFNPPAGTYGPGQTVALSSTTAGATMRFTTDGTTPSETAGNIYTSPISITNGMTIRAIAYLSGFIDSSVVSGAYTISTGSAATREYIRLGGKVVAAENALLQAVATPTFNPPGGTYTSTQSVALSTATANATIRYTTDGSTPSETAGTIYSGPISVASSMTIKAIAYESGWTDSAVASASYTITGSVAPPTFSPAAGTYTSAQSVTITTSTPNATIRYTTDGSNPSETVGTIYSGPITVASSMTLKAMAYESGWTDSTITSAGYTITGSVAPPSFSPAAGTYTSGQSVYITTSTPGATIRYTTDGSTPSETAGTIYTGPVAVNSSATLKAIAYEAGWIDSAVTSATYTITGTVGTPWFSPGGGTYNGAQAVSIYTGTSGATIRYTTDGSNPSETYGAFYTGPITVSSSLTIKAIAYESGWIDSSINSATYTILVPPSLGPVSPIDGTSSSSGAYNTFNVTLNGGSYPLQWAQILVNGGLNTYTSCLMYYDATNHIIYMGGNGSNAYYWTGSAYLSSAPSYAYNYLGNNQCELNVGYSYISASGNSVTLTLYLAFNPNWPGGSFYLYDHNTAGYEAGWGYEGWWSNPLPTSPMVGPVEPRDQSGTGTLFTLTSSGGNAPLSWTQVLFSNSYSSPDGTNSCLIYFDQASGNVYLGGDGSNPYNWAGSATLGTTPNPSNPVLSNSQCSLYTGSSSFTNPLYTNYGVYLNLYLVFNTSNWAGYKYIYMSSENVWGQWTGYWPQLGWWYVP